MRERLVNVTPRDRGNGNHRFKDDLRFHVRRFASPFDDNIPIPVDINPLKSSPKGNYIRMWTETAMHTCGSRTSCDQNPLRQ